MAEALSEAELGAIVSQQIGMAKSHDQSERANSRDKALDYFFGRMDAYVPPETNRSKVVSTDVADMLSTVLPQVIREFSSSGQFAQVEPTEDIDEDFARQATQGLNYVFLKDNDGEGLLYDGTWDALMHANAVVKTFWDETPVYATSFHSGLTEDQVALLLQDEDIEVLAKSEREEPMLDQMSGAMVPTKVFDLKIKRQKAPGKFVIDVIPPEEFLIDANAVETADAAFTDHWQRKTRSDLVAMGYDKAKVGSIPEAARSATPEQSARDPSGNSYDASDRSMQLVDYHECFIRIDVDGDGEAELCRVCSAGPVGEVILSWEVWEDEHPFDDIKCKPIPHRWLGRSLPDDTIDIQDVKTVLRRQFLNNIYWANNPQRFVKGKIHNPDQLENPTFGGAIMGDANSEIVNLEVPMIGEAALQGIAHMDDVAQRRTGIVAQGEAVDPDELNTKTAAEVHDKKDARYLQVAQYARSTARGWSNVLRKLLRLMVKHQDYARKVMFNGKPVVIDPRYWNEDMHVTVDVGLGTGSRDRDMMMLGQTLQNQLMLADRFMQAEAFDDAIDMLPKIIATMTKMAESAGIHNPEDFYPEYTEDKVAQLKQMAAQRSSQPDPKMQIEQMKAQSAQAIQASEMQSNQIKAQAEMQKSQADAQVKLMQAHSDARAAQLEAELAQAELQIRQLEIQSKTDTERWKAELSSFTTLRAAEISAGAQTDQTVLDAQLESDLGFQQHQMNLAEAEQAHQHALAQQASAPKPQPAPPA